MLWFLRLTQGLSTYDYIVAMRELEQEQEQLGVGGHQSPQMSTVSSFTALSSVSSFNALHRGAWCTPPRMFLEDQVTYSQARHAFLYYRISFSS
jgi:palmitoyltransferase ZDHHC1/11